MKRLRYILKSRYLFKILFIFFLILSIVYTKCYSFKSKYNIKKDNTFIGTIIDYEIKEDKITILLKGKEKILINYKYNDLVFDLKYGDKISVKGSIYEPTSSTNFNSFDYKKYLYNKKIYYIVTASSIDKIENNKNYIYKIKNYLYEKVDNLKSKDYIKTLLFNDNNLSSDIKKNYRLGGFSTLFSVYKIHISLIIYIIYYYLDKITYKKNIKYIIGSIFLLLYLLLFYSSVILKYVIIYILTILNYIFKLEIKRLDILFITFIIVVIINPFIIYDIGFLYSYIINLFICLFMNRVKKKKNKFLKAIYVSFICFIVSFPITVYTSYEINVLSFIINFLFVPIISFVLFILSFITFIFPIFDEILYFAIVNLEKIVLFISKIDIFRIVFYKASIIVILLYYIAIFIGLKKYKYFYLFLIITFIHLMIPYLNNKLTITMFDVKEADSIAVIFPHNIKNILIDTGKEYSCDNIISYYKSNGINKIDYLILTHGDFDHMGEAINLVNNFKVENVIFNCGEYNDLEKELIKVLNKKKIKYYSCVKELNIDKYKLQFLNTKEYDNENDNSNVIYFNYNGYKFLFMGDSGIEKEKDILYKYSLKDIDFLKVGHHGSSTSSSEYFIDSIEPKYSLISVGKNNRYGHPKEEVLETLKNSKIYRTDIDGSIEIKLNKNGYKIRTCRP